MDSATPTNLQPLNKVKSTPKDFVLNFGAIVSLYVVAISFLAFIFQIINYAFPDTNIGYYSSYSNPYSTALRLAISTLIVAFPLLLVLGRTIHSDLLSHIEKRELSLRKWLIYITLFVAGATLAIDLVVLLNTFLNGDITIRFVLKVLAVLVIAGLIFGYYISDLRGVFYSSPKKLRIFYIVVSVIMLISVISGFFIIGSPTSQRLIRADQQKINDMSNIQSQVTDYYQKSGTLPASLTVLQDPISGYSIPKDSTTHTFYEYSIVSSSGSAPQFKLCSTFNLDSVKNNPSLYIDTLSANENWIHAKGYTCFTRTIDPVKYPFTKNNTPLPGQKPLQTF